MTPIERYINNGQYREAIAEEFRQTLSPQDNLPGSPGRRVDVVSVRMGLGAQYGVSAAITAFRRDCPDVGYWLLWCYAGDYGRRFQHQALQALVAQVDRVEAEALEGVVAYSKAITLLGGLMDNFQFKHLNGRELYTVTHMAEALGLSRAMFYNRELWGRVLKAFRSALYRFDSECVDQLAMQLSRQSEQKATNTTLQGLMAIG